MEAGLGSCPWVTGPGAAALSSPLAGGEAGVQITAGNQAAAGTRVWRLTAGFGCGPATRQLQDAPPTRTCSSVRERPLPTSGGGFRTSARGQVLRRRQASSARTPRPFLPRRRPPTGCLGRDRREDTERGLSTAERGPRELVPGHGLWGRRWEEVAGRGRAAFGSL